MADHDFSVNVVVNRDMKVAGLFAGDLVAAHRAAVRLARDLYMVPAAPDADLTIVSGHPQDSEFLQAGKALGEYGAPATARPDGVVLFAAAATLGFGVHYLGERRRRRPAPRRAGHRPTCIGARRPGDRRLFARRHSNGGRAAPPGSTRLRQTGRGGGGRPGSRGPAPERPAHAHCQRHPLEGLPVAIFGNPFPKRRPPA